VAAVKMTAKRRFNYAAKVIEPGDKFTADTEQDANVLTVVGHAEREVEVESKRTYKRRDMRVEH
jgi:hypothetical protein